MRSLLVSALLLCLASFGLAISAVGSRLLVILDDPAAKGRYSKFWTDLQDRGFEIDYRAPKADTNVFRHGERVYDHLIILPSQLKALGPALTANILLDFLKAGGNILLGLSSSVATPSSIVSLLIELDIQLPTDKSSVVVDHFAYDTVSAAKEHNVLLVSHPKQLRQDVGNFFSGDGTIAFPRGVGQLPGQGQLLAPILSAPRTAYSYSTKEEAEAIDELFASGSQMALVTALQARNSARFTVVGSAEMLEDVWFDANVKLPGGSKQSKTANRLFASQVSGWTFQETGVLKVGTIEHWLDERSNYLTGKDNNGLSGRKDINPSIYRVKNDVTFSIEISKHTPSDGLAPFTPPVNDALQLEFTMLSPYHRLPLVATSQTANSTIFTARFKVPDQHGIFAFNVNYKRPFLTNIEEKRHVTIRHFAHDEFSRSWEISGAWVWIAGIGATVIGWVAFVAVWLYGEPVQYGSTEKKRQ